MNTAPSTAPSLQSLMRRISYLTALGGVLTLAYVAYQESRQPIAPRHTNGDRKINNPWRGLPGCLLLQSDTPSAVQKPRYWSLANGMEWSCGTNTQAATGKAAPAHAKDIINAVYPLIAPAPDARMLGGETATIGKQTIAKSADVLLTLNADTTLLANALTSCLTTANAEDCQLARLDSKRFAHLHEGAGTRMVAIVDMRIDTGAVQTLASAHSPCFDAMVNKKAVQPNNCPSMPEQYVKANTWRSSHHALTNQAMWASTVKPALALALLRGGAIQTEADQQWLRNALKTSATSAFLNRLFCRQKNGSFNPQCKPLTELARAGLDLGYSSSTGKGVDLLQGSASSLHTPAPHWMELAPSNHVNPPRTAWTPLTLRTIEPALLESCYRNEWSGCRGEHLADIAAQGWGQGDSKATALTAAASFSRLGAAANAAITGKKAATATTVHEPTLLSTPQSPQAPQSLGVEPLFAAAIVEGMALTHTTGGTAHSACSAVWGVTACNQLKGLAGKTGTSTFAHDQYTLTQRFDVCRDVAVRIASIRSSGGQPSASDWVENAHCTYAPYKWYVALVKNSNAPNAPWTRVIAVQIERNWGINGAVDSADDKKGINIAAFTAMQYIGLTQIQGIEGKK